MDNVIIERQVQRAIREAFGDKGIRLLKGIRKLAAKQSVENAVQNNADATFFKFSNNGDG